MNFLDMRQVLPVVGSDRSVEHSGTNLMAPFFSWFVNLDA